MATDGNLFLVKRNNGASNIYGITAEARANYNRLLQIEGGITLQKSRYEELVEWSQQLPGTKEYLRTPNAYGYYTLTYNPNNRFSTSLSGIYTWAYACSAF